MATSSAQSPSWTGNDVWIQDEWTDEDKSKARDQLASESQRQTAGQALTDFGRNASTNWNVFYQQNKTNFFKDRHYLHKAFPEEFGWLYDDSASDGNRKDIRIVEIGCGVGNAILPLLEQHSELVKRFKELKSDASPPQLHIHALDFAPTAVKLLKEDPRFQSASKEGRATAHVYDASSMHPSTIFITGYPGETTQQHVLANSADIAILLFCLSAIGPHPSPALGRAARHACAMLKPGGTLLIRDYGRLDEGKKISYIMYLMISSPLS
jgi:methyltransferase-like protein 6